MPQHQTIFQFASVEASVCKTNIADWVKTKSMQLNAYSMDAHFSSAGLKKCYIIVGMLMHLKNPSFFLLFTKLV